MNNIFLSDQYFEGRRTELRRRIESDSEFWGQLEGDYEYALITILSLVEDDLNKSVGRVTSRSAWRYDRAIRCIFAKDRLGTNPPHIGLNPVTSAYE